MILQQPPEPARDIVFLLGPAGSGKTARAIEHLRECEARGESALYLVPEQSTYLADRQILEPPGPEAICRVRVVSFRRLCMLLEDPVPGMRQRTLDRSGRRILLRALFARLDPDVRRPFEAVADRPGFVESLVRVLGEIRAESGSDAAAWFEAIGDSVDLSGDLRAKLATLAALRRAYDEALVSRGLRDPELLMLETPARIASHPEMFRGKSVIVDGFLSFTRLETEILAAIGRAGAQLTIMICIDPALARLVPEIAPMPPRCRIEEWPIGMAGKVDRPAFLATLRTLAEVRARMHAAGLATRFETIAEAPRRFRSAGLAQLEAQVLRRPSFGTGPAHPADPPTPAIELLAARDPAHEVEIWARRIDRWIRVEEEPVRPGEIAIIVRDTDAYRAIVEETFARYHIPVFVDRHWDISSRPIVRTILDALDVINAGWPRESVIAFLRSPLLGSRAAEVDLLENLSLEGGYDFEQWIGGEWQPLRRPPRTRYVRGSRDSDEERAEDGDSAEAGTAEYGTEDGAADGATEAETDEDATSDPILDAFIDQREQIRVRISNRLRREYLEPLRDLGERLLRPGIDGDTAVAELRAWIATSGISTREIPEEIGASDHRREVEAVEHVLDQIAAETAGSELPAEALARLLAAGLDSLELGRTPTRLDAVTLAEVQRSRLGEVRRAIVGGFSASDFPRAVASERFFNDRERAELARLGLDLGPPDPLRQEAEAYFLYIALTRASERLVLTRPTADIEGASLDPSPFLEEIRSAVPGLREVPPPIEEDPADLRDAQTAEELAARVGAYIAARLDRRVSGRGAAPEPARAEEEDRRILTVYNQLVLPAEGLEVETPRFVREASRLWGYDNRASLPPEIVRFAIGERRLTASVTHLESFARCPYQHFARSVLKLKRRPEAEVTPIEGGLLTHKALEILLEQGAPPADRSLIRQRLEQVFDTIRDEPDFRAYHVTPGGLLRWQTARGQLARFVEIEARRIGASQFRPHEFEKAFGAAGIDPLRIPLPGDGELLLRGRIDRIDTYGDAPTVEALVIDYKSGSISNKGRPADVMRGSDLQLATYLLVVREVFGMRPFGALYAPVLPRPTGDPSSDPQNPLDIRLSGLAPTTEWDRIGGHLKLIRGSRPAIRTAADLEDLLRSAREILTLYAEAILEGRIDIAPAMTNRKTPCDSCEFASLCRVSEVYNPTRATPLEGFSPAGGSS
jgi:ATP-dependent helicase/nuclease subunit B